MSKYHTSMLRSGKDRRKDSIKPKFPFYDSGGNLVTHERRKLPDRRLRGITVEWINAPDLEIESPDREDSDNNAVVKRFQDAPLAI